MTIWYKYGDNSAPHSNEDKVGISKGEQKNKDIFCKKESTQGRILWAPVNDAQSFSELNP